MRSWNYEVFQKSQKSHTRYQRGLKTLQVWDKHQNCNWADHFVENHCFYECKVSRNLVFRVSAEATFLRTKAFRGIPISLAGKSLSGEFQPLCTTVFNKVSNSIQASLMLIRSEKVFFSNVWNSVRLVCASWLFFFLGYKSGFPPRTDGSGIKEGVTFN